MEVSQDGSGPSTLGPQLDLQILLDTLPEWLAPLTDYAFLEAVEGSQGVVEEHILEDYAIGRTVEVTLTLDTVAQFEKEGT